MTTIDIEMPPWSDPLWEPKRYKVLYGGRGSSKSWTVATYLVTQMASASKRVLCARELQKSIKESAHKLLADRIDSLGLSNLFEVGESFIRGKNGSEAIFLGLRHNVNQVKSLEGVDICWVEEAQTISQASWDVLVPTIRKPGSEFLVTFNPENDDDATFDMFVNRQQPDAWVRKVNYDENPWFPPELEAERIKMQAQATDADLLDKYNHIWLGMCRKSAQGAIYGGLMAAAADDKRITAVPYNPSFPVIVSWDLGYSDSTSLWFAQIVGREPRIIDFYEDSLKPLSHYVSYLKSKPYVYDKHVLPHDAGHLSLRTGKTLVAQLEEMGLGRVDRDLIVLPQDSIASGIELSRQLIPQLWFDSKCEQGIKCLKKYHYEWDEDRQKFKDSPEHDWSSHAADSFRYLATYLATKKDAQMSKVKINIPQYAQPQGWMG